MSCIFDSVRRHLNYRNTPHLATGKAPAELVFRRSIKTRLPKKTVLLEKKEVEEAIEGNKYLRFVRKEHFNNRKQTVEKLIDVRDTILVKQTKSTIKLLFDPALFKVIEVPENNTTLQRDSKNIKVASSN